jgi:hypothetical protein
MSIDFPRVRQCLHDFEFQRLFVQELGWSRPKSVRPVSFEARQRPFTRREIAQLAGVVVFEIQDDEGRIPDAKLRAAVHKQIAELHFENLLVFVDRDRSQSLWYWVKRQAGKSFPREHLFVRGQPGDLFVSKLGQMVFDLSDFDEEANVSLIEVARRMRSALDVERVTKKFFRDFEDQHVAFLELIQGVADERQRRWYASVLLNRLMFIYFLQKKGFLDRGDLNYLRSKLNQSQQQGTNCFFRGFLRLLFFEGFAKPPAKRATAAQAVLGEIRYLNGGLFLPHKVEQDNPKLDVPDRAFENLFDLFDRYSWNLDDTPGGKDDEINPGVLGYIFEKYINQKAFGAYYTRPEITDYLCERTIHRLILDAVNTPEAAKAHPVAGVKVRTYETLGDLLMDLDKPLCKRLLNEVLPGLSLLDPACGSGAFLVAAMKALINVYAAVVGRIKFLQDRNLTAWLADIEKNHPSVGYFIKKRIITDNLFGVDIMEEATEIARLRLFLALVASAQSVDDLEPLPNIDFNILPGNSLIGLMRVNDADFEKRNAQGNLFRRSYKQVLADKNRLIDVFRHASDYADDLTATRDAIDEKKREAYETLNDILLDEFQALGIKYEEATWDTSKNKEGKPKKRSLQPADVEALHPFHWGFEFDEILNRRGGFDAIITNPPWETFQPDAKEFFADHSELVTKKSMDIKDFEVEQARLLRDPDVMAAWLQYHSGFNHQRHYFRFAPEYENQVPIVDGKRHGKDVNLFKLFLERSLHLLRRKGACGIVVPSGIYTDLGAMKLREMLFSQTQVTGLFGFENRRAIFEGVDSRFKFVVLTFEKGGHTDRFPAAFMRHDVTELRDFSRHTMEIPVDMVRRLSPDSLSVMEFKSELDIEIAEKMLHAPLLGGQIAGIWNLELHREFNMTDDAPLFEKSQSTGCIPLYEGKMIWQFDHRFSEPRYWISEKKGRKELMSARVRRIMHCLQEAGQSAEVDENAVTLEYECYRLGYRDIAASTNERAMICTVLPPRVFAGNTLNLQRAIQDVCEKDDWRQVPSLSGHEMLYLSAVFNSFAIDWMIRQKITSHLNMFYVYQLPVPRAIADDTKVAPIVDRAARLICTTPEFDALAKEVGLKSHKQGVTDAAQRAVLRAELDGLVAHLYGLTEAEFAHVLSTFPLVPDPVKIAAHNAYRDVERGLIR